MFYPFIDIHINVSPRLNAAMMHVVTSGNVNRVELDLGSILEASGCAVSKDRGSNYSP